MKKKLAFWAMLAGLLAFGMALAGCDTGGGGAGDATSAAYVPTPITLGGDDEGTGQGLTVIITDIPATYNGQQATVLLTVGNYEAASRFREGTVTNGKVTVDFGKDPGYSAAYGWVYLSPSQGSTPSDFQTAYYDRGCPTKCDYNAGTFTVSINDFTRTATGHGWWE